MIALAAALVFAGLHSATTCIPGPVGGDRPAVYHLTWSAARGAHRRVVYDVYQATSPGAENFTRPTYSTRATVFATSALSSSVTYYFVVRARDASGARDRNRREVRGMNLCV